MAPLLSLPLLPYFPTGSEPDWVLDLVATGFSKPLQLFGSTLRTKADVNAAADAFKADYLKVRVGHS